MTGPITPEKARKNKPGTIPEAMFEVVNELLTEKYSEHEIRIERQEIVDRFCFRLQASRALDPMQALYQMLSNGWLDFEQAYRDAGWSVSYDKPGYNETYEAAFIFKKKSR